MFECEKAENVHVNRGLRVSDLFRIWSRSLRRRAKRALQISAVCDALNKRLIGFWLDLMWFTPPPILHTRVIPLPLLKTGTTNMQSTICRSQCASRKVAFHATNLAMLVKSHKVRFSGAFRCFTIPASRAFAVRFKLSRFVGSRRKLHLVPNILFHWARYSQFYCQSVQRCSRRHMLIAPVSGIT